MKWLRTIKPRAAVNSTRSEGEWFTCAIMRACGGSAVSNRFLPSIVAAANAVVAGLRYAILGWSLAGAHAATRNTARFSAICFAIAFAGPALARLGRRVPSEAILILALVAAQGIHFAAVIALLSIFERAHVAHNPLQTAVVFTVGFGLVLVASLTAQPRVGHCYRATRAFVLYAIFLIFTLAFATNRVKPWRGLLVLFVAALVLRVSARFQNRAQAASAH